VAKDVSLPSTADVIAVTGGHPGNPWREQHLLSLYGVTPQVAPAATVAPGPQPLPAAA
jgi:hypothetical protein